MEEVYTRKMASVQEVNGVYPIEGADKICQYGIQGWRVVDQVGKYKVGDMVVYCTIDSWVPATIAPFLSKGKEPRVYNGIPGEKLRTIRLRKALSQGLLLPLTVLDHVESELFVGLDVSFPLGIVKWEAPPEFTSADAKGNFPSFIIKTDQERVQSCYGDVSKYFETETFEISEKCEGSSMTVYYRDGEFGCCSRNLDLKRSDENTYWKMAVQFDLENKLKALGKNIAIQGELCGPKICGNIYNHDKFYWFIFDVFDIDTFSYYTPVERRALTKELGLVDVPVLKTEATLLGETCASLLTMADGKSVLGIAGCLREGLVFKSNAKERISFKAVSNLYLEKGKE